MGQPPAAVKVRAGRPSAMDTLDVVLLHVPRFEAGRRELMVMPLGLPALARLLADDGHRVELVHLGIESEVASGRGGFSLEGYLRARRPALVLASLHWAGQTRPVLDLADRLSGWLPGARVFLGGLTASVFAAEIVRSLPFVAGVVRGDGEEPARALGRVVVRGEGSLEDVPNLVFRGPEGEPRESRGRWCVDERYAGGLHHGSLAQLRSRGAYLSRALYADFSPGARGAEGYPFAAYLNAGRGCTRACPCCGGAAPAQRVTSGRDGLVLYPLDKLLRDAREAHAEGARALRVSFDPPGARRRTAAWLRGIAREGLALRGVYDLWDLPSAAFLESLARSLAPGSTVVYSPECGSERIRRMFRPRSFTNEALLRSVAEAEAAGLEVHVFFSAGLPRESPAEVDETARLVERLRARTRAAVSVATMELDPASPAHREPERFGVRLVRRTLRDFYDGRGLPGGPGYETEHFDEAGVLAAVGRLRALALG